jgi:hypothetical protein
MDTRVAGRVASSMLRFEKSGEVMAVILCVKFGGASPLAVTANGTVSGSCCPVV